MKLSIHILCDNSKNKENIRKFLFSQIKKEYGYGYVPHYHQDIIDLDKFYIKSKNSNMFFVVDNDINEIIATIAVRSYDKNFEEFQGIYTKKSTASIWRLFVDNKYRRKGLATKLFKIVEEFCYMQNYNEIYLHTHKNLVSGFSFWKKMGFKITLDTNNDLQTVHMIKKLNKSKKSNLLKIPQKSTVSIKIS